MRFGITRLSVLIGLLLAQTALAGEIKVLSAGALEPGLKPVIAEFQKQSGHTVTATFNTAPQIQKRIADGEKWDMVIAPPAFIGQFTKAGRTAGNGVEVGRVGIGIAVRPLSLVPEITPLDRFKQSLLSVDSIVFNRASSGQHFENALKKMGIYEKVKGKITRYDTGAQVMEHVLKGKGAELGIGPITEIQVYRREHDLKYVGPVPDEIQHYTSYTAIATSNVSDKAAVQAFLSHLGGADSRELLRRAGVQR